MLYYADGGVKMSKRKVTVISRKKKKQNNPLFYIVGSAALFAAALAILPRFMQCCTGILYKAANKHNLGCNKKPGFSRKKKYK